MAPPQQQHRLNVCGAAPPRCMHHTVIKGPTGPKGTDGRNGTVFKCGDILYYGGVGDLCGITGAIS